jgi:hypothetical protein
MWDLVSAREVYWRRAGGACEKWSFEPDGLPADYKGTLTLEQDDLRFSVRYEGGSPPALSKARVTHGAGGDAGAKVSFFLPCEERGATGAGGDAGDAAAGGAGDAAAGDAGDAAADEAGAGAWYDSAEACAQGGTALLRPTGCVSAVEPEARPRWIPVVLGQKREAFERALEHASRVWMQSVCFSFHVRPAPASYRSDIPSVLPGATRALALEGYSDYPSLLAWTHMGFALGEIAETDPYFNRRGTEELGTLGCCSDAEHFVVVDYVDGVADVLKLRKDGQTRPDRWWVNHPPPRSVTSSCKVRF